MKTETQIRKRLTEIERQPIWSGECRGEWKGLVWALGEKREFPWKKGEYFNENGNGRR